MAGMAGLSNGHWAIRRRPRAVTRVPPVPGPCYSAAWRLAERAALG